ncbi:MAG: TonB-dependent receptor [Pseudomonadales bacterium]|nr:TonB-dependent receptor [Pseudomonadales bacterium]
MPRRQAAEDVEVVVVTGSRLAREPSELSRNVIVLDREAIRATGEFTLPRVLQQLPQNTNPTNATYGSRLNGVNNKTGAATVNLRGLGSESTLILVDGRRVGYSGVLGGVTDISTIPLSMVERIEVQLDGASAVYGSDAVGGVVNIITRQDYTGVEVDVDYGRPHESGFTETRVSIAGGFAWTGGRGTVGFERYRDSGLDSSLRESIILQSRLQTSGQKNTAAGPQIRVYTDFYNEECIARDAILWELNGTLLTIAEYATLDPEEQANATCLDDLTLPLGFRHTDDLQSIDRFGEQHWGEEAEVGYSLTPEQTNSVVNIGIDQDLTDDMVLHATLRLGNKESSSENGLNSRGARLAAKSPFNPFGRWVDLTGLAVDLPTTSFESEQDDLFANVGLEGSFGDWRWLAEYGLSRQDGDTTRLNVRHPDYFNGVNSDGVTESVIARQRGQDEAACQALQAELGGTRYTYSPFFGGQCSIYGPPPDPIDPFGDISAWIIPGVDAGYRNQQTRFEALVRGSLFDAPGGAVAVALGYDFREDVLDSFSEFTSFYINSSSATGSGPFDTLIARDNHAVFLEGLVPLIGADNASDVAQSLMLTFSARYDSYSNVDVEYEQTDTQEGGTLEAADPGSKTTWSLGMVYQPADSLRLKADVSTSFVAPQLNQLLSRVRQNSAAVLWYYVDPLRIGQLTGNVIEYTGGNDKLTPETAETTSVSAEFSPSFLPGAYLKAGWSDTEFVDRIVKLSVPVVDLDALPSNVFYNPDEDIYVVDRRWINASVVSRDGVDLEFGYTWQMEGNDFDFILRRAYNNGYEVVQDATTGIVHDLIGMRDDTGPEDTTLSPVPKHQTSMQFIWARGGLFASLDVHTADDTTIMNSATREYLTEPANNYDLVLSYDLGSDTFFRSIAWMSGMTATLTINNVGDSFARTTNINPETNERRKSNLNPIYEWTQGRSYRLSIHKSF